MIGILTILSLLSGAVAVASPGTPVINEFVFNHTGTDTHEYVELFGDPSTSYSTLTILQIEGDGLGAGVIDSVHVVGTTDANGFWTTAFLNNKFENGTVTLLLVQGFSGAVGNDLDTNNDGVLDSIPWTSLVDDVAVSDGGASDRTYSAVVLTPGFDGGIFTPGGASRIPNGTDTDTVSNWVRNDFDGLGLPGFGGAAPPIGFRTIMEIQGTGQFSPLEGSVVETMGVVTLFTADGTNLWIQDPLGDGNTATSDGVFVNIGVLTPEARNTPGETNSLLIPLSEVSVGDLIGLVAEVDELQFGNALPLTRLRAVQEVEILSSGNPLPAPVAITDLPNESIADAIAFWEPLEGMMVSIENGFVVSSTNQFGEFALLAEADADADLGSGYFAQTKQILIRSLGGGAVDYNPERILVDDSSLEDPIVVMLGDRVRSLVGTLDYTFGNYKIQPADFEVKTHRLPRLPASTRSGPMGDTVITTFNVENLFDLVDDPAKDDEGSTPTAAELETQLTKLALAIQFELGLPEIIVVQEVENQAILQELGDLVNDAVGTNYMATSFESSDERGIEVGFLWDDDRVDLLDAFQLTDAIVPGVSAAFGPASPSPGREPIVGIFEIAGQEITIIGNHFKSKSGDDPLFGVNDPPIRVTEVQRTAQAQVVRDYVNLLLDADPEALVMVAGDLNDFQFGEPGEGANHPLAILEGISGEVPLTNLINLERAAKTFTFVFDGNSQVLDHILVSPALFELFVAVDILHFDAGFPSYLEDDSTTPLRASDHDAVETRFQFM